MKVICRIPAWFGAWGLTVFPFIFIVPEHATDDPMYQHELVHWNEQWKMLVVGWWLAYLLSATFRRDAEVRAYRVQIALGGCTLSQASAWLSSNYRLGITPTVAATLLHP